MLRLSRTALDAMIAHAQAEYPKEACGLLAGTAGHATRAVRMRNVDASPISYTMDPKEQLHVMKRLRTDHLETLAIYHSHTATAAYPSTTDIQLATYPDVTYVLVSLANQAQPDVKGYHIVDGTVTAEPLEIVPPARAARV